ncbi:E3 ubiquitin-protein ligase At3g02290-like isoform X2 [Bidens hawaiensis]|uniref:E3 ubiquitin-protein ligase At3g02290-like isoform X2 n=1 Tax=Bidens hawaiensis TaxID=980011 RepID=UPI00404AA776
MLIPTVLYTETAFAFDAFFRISYIWYYTSLFQRGDEHVRLQSPSSMQGTTSFNSSASLDSSLSGVYRAPPRPLPYDVDPRYIRLQRDGLVSRREKGSSRSLEEGDPLRGSDSDMETDLLCAGSKWNNNLTCEDETKGPYTKSSIKLLSPKEATGFAHILSPSEDEDVCPTCLEEYTTENPKIITKCSHHFHLGCIYEWMERSENCPVCGKVMAFDETIEA